MLPSLRALVFPMAQCSTSSAQNCKRLRSYIQHNCALPDADDLAPRAQNFKIANLPMAMIWLCARKNSKLQTPDADDLAQRAQNIKIADLPMPHISFTSTKTSILCSKCPKTGVPNPKSAQKPRFCARTARKRGLRRPKKHKNPDFVLEKPENEGSEG